MHCELNPGMLILIHHYVNIMKYVDQSAVLSLQKMCNVPFKNPFKNIYKLDAMHIFPLETF